MGPVNGRIKLHWIVSKMGTIIAKRFFVSLMEISALNSLPTSIPYYGAILHRDISL